MRILGIETTGPFCSAAILDGDDIEERLSEEKLNHLTALTPMIEELLSCGGFRLTDMDAIAVSAGPGSFTGIRIGVSTGRGLNQVSGVPLISVPTLFAFGCSEYEGNKMGTVCPLLNARRGQVYAGAYNDFCEIVPGGPYMLDEFLEKTFAAVSELKAAAGSGSPAGFDAASAVFDAASAGAAGNEEGNDPGQLLFVGDGVDAYSDMIREICMRNGYLPSDDGSGDGGKEKTAGTFVLKSKYQDAAGVCEMAADMIADPDTFGERLGLSYDELKPEYMRMTEAEQRLRDGTLGKGIAGKSNGMQDGRKGRGPKGESRKGSK